MSRHLSPTLSFVGVSVVFASFFLAAGAPTPLLALRQQQWGFSAGVLSVAFSVYALALLVALLVGGSLSDHVGRRPVILAALYGELASMVVFVVAPTVGWVITARALQGLATGLGTSAFSAAIAEHAPARLKGRAAGIAAASVAGGLGLGALLTGAAIQFTAAANSLVFGGLAAVMAVSLVFVSMTPETAPTRPGALQSLKPALGVPKHLRGEFLGGVPVQVAGWMFPAFFLGLSPAVLRLHFGLDGGLVTGFTAFVGPFTAAVAGFAFAGRSPRRATVVGLVLLLAGMLTVLAGVDATALPVVWLGAVLGGAGFGGTFGGQLRTIGPKVLAHERAGVFAGIYAAAYLSFGIPVIIAGQLAPHWGLIPTFDAYAVVVIVSALVGLLTQAVLARREVGAPVSPLMSVR